jgi:tetratricopeptide (TPR) repeat protein
MTRNRNGRVVTFYSYKGGTGRTMALANVAWILAANGKRVLAVDWDLESPGLFRFFNPFLSPHVLSSASGVVELIRDYEWATGKSRPIDWAERFARVEKYSFSLRWDHFPGDGSLDYLSAGQQNHDYATTLAAGSWDDFYENRNGGEFFDALRADMKRHYDYVLIDSRTGLSDGADICTKHLPDVLVDCFTLSEQGIEGSAQMARTVRDYYGRRNIRILPVPMRVDPAEKQKADAGRFRAMELFAGLPEGMSEPERERYWAGVQVPYVAFYAYEEVLATFGDTPGVGGSLLQAYEDLTGYITDGDVSELPQIDPELRQAVASRFERRVTQIERTILLRYFAGDQVWAEWIEHLLTAAGVRVVTARPAEDADGESDVSAPDPAPESARELIIISAANLAEEQAYVAPEGATVEAPLAIYLADVTPAKNIAIANSAFVSNVPEQTAAERILGLVNRSVSDLPARLEGAPRYPGIEAKIFDAPARNSKFTGRESHLARLRSMLQSGGSAVALLSGQTQTGLPVAVRGMGGVGKTQLAIEYAHRFRSAYDVVWWISTDPVTQVETSMTDLVDQIRRQNPSMPGIDTELTGPERVRTATAILSRFAERWLLIYDNAEDPEELRRFMPQERGHILITSRNPSWGEAASELPVDVFQRRESMAHLVTRVPGMLPEDANAVAELLADLPIAVAAAGAWLAETGTSVKEYLSYIRDRGPSGMTEPGSDEPIEKTWDLSLNGLRDRSQAAYRLLQLCSVMAPEIALDLVYSDQMAEFLRPYDPSISEPIMLGRPVQEINRLALLRLDQPGEDQGRDGSRSGQILVHRVLQSVVRSRMSSDELAEARRQAQLVLAAGRPPGDVDKPENWPKYRMIWPHLDIADAVKSDAEPVRRLVIDRVRYQWIQGDTASGRARAAAAVDEWTKKLAAIPEDDAEARATLERQLLHLKFNMANLVRDLGEFEASRAMNAEVLRRQAELLGAEHPHTLMTAGGLAGDLRGLGRYAEALELDQSTHQSWMDRYGEDHERTLAALNNLATCNRLMGDFRTARERDEQALRRRRVVLGRKNPFTLYSAANLGRDIRDAGEYERSVMALTNVHDLCVETRGADSRAALTARSNLAVSLRSAGRHGEALQMHEEAYEKLLRLFGEDNPETLSCHMSLALSRLAIGDAEAAAADFDALAELYLRSSGGSHPFTLVCRNNLGIALRAAGASGRGRPFLVQASEGLGAVLGAEHPYTISAEMNLGIFEADAGELESARLRFEETAATMVRVLGPEHPNTLRCQGNIALVLRQLGDPGGTNMVDASQQRLFERIGPDHPASRAFQNGRYLYRVIDPHPH